MSSQQKYPTKWCVYYFSLVMGMSHIITCIFIGNGNGNGLYNNIKSQRKGICLTDINKEKKSFHCDVPKVQDTVRI